MKERMVSMNMEATSKLNSAEEMLTTKIRYWRSYKKLRK